MRRPPLSRRTALWTALVYALVAGLWIVFSDRLLALVLNGVMPAWVELQTLKGLAFVVVTAALLYGLIAHLLYLMRQSEARYRELFEANPIPMWVYDLDTLKFLAVNDAACRHYGYSRDEFLSMTIADIRPEEDVPRLLESVARSRRQPGYEEAGLWRHRKKDGTVIDVEIHSHSVALFGRPARLVMAKDVTEERRLLEENLAIAKVVAASPAVTFSWRADPEPIIEHVSANIRRLGYDPETILSGALTFGDIVHPDDRDRVIEEAMRFRARGYESFKQSYRIVTPDGRIRWIDDFNTVVRDERSGTARYLTLAIDVTERKEAELALQQSEAMLQRAQQVARMGSWRFDPNTGLFAASPEVYRLYGLPPGQPLRYEDFRATFHPEDAALVDKVWYAALEEGRYELEYRVIVEGRVRWLREVAAFEFDPEGHLLGGVGTVQDVTERKAHEAIILRQAQVLEQSPSIVVLTDTAGVIEYVNRRFTEVTGYTPDEAIGRYANLLKSGLLDDATYVELWQTITAGRVWRGEFPDRKKSGELYWEQAVIAPIFDEQGTITHFVKLAEDITDKKALSARVEHLAFYDPLTGLPNRALLVDRLEQALVAARRGEYRVAVAFIDLDDFKVINDSLGHEAGDRLLVDVAKRLDELLRDDDTVARFGGDEFVLLLNHLTAAADASLVAERVLAALAEPFTFVQEPIFTGASIGISVFPDDADSVQALLQHADAALNRAKQEGRRRYQFFTPELNLQIQERRQLEGAIRQGLARGEFFLYYQPRVDLLSGRIVSVEALVRWQHPTLGLVLPGRFIPLAEQSGLIVDLGQEVLRQACRQVKQWLDEGISAVPVAVNLSAKEFLQADLAPKIARILQETGLPPPYLEIEVTESAAMREVAQTIDTFNALRALGVSIAIDDFGTAYSSLNYLKRLPVNALKIDRSFVLELSETASQQDAAIVRAMIGLGRTYGLVVVAEGVETDYQRQFLKSNGCRYAQGYLFGKPMAAAEIEARLRPDGASPHTAPRA